LTFVLRVVIEGASCPKAKREVEGAETLIVKVA